MFNQPMINYNYDNFTTDFIYYRAFILEFTLNLSHPHLIPGFSGVNGGATLVSSIQYRNVAKIFTKNDN